MKRNGMCPFCYLAKIFMKKQKVTEIYSNEKYGENICPTPPMGWSSWNTFRNRIDENLIYETGLAMRDKKLIDAGYKYINLDDNWHSSLRDANGDLQGDLTTFAHGIPTLVSKLNDLGLKVGIYSSNGTLTCEDLPASLHNEQCDANTFAKWGIEYFKYDFCHNEQISQYAPWVYGITISKLGENETVFYPCTDARLEGYAKFMPARNLPIKKMVTGLDANGGAMQFDNIKVDEDGEYVLTIDIKKKGKYEKFLLAIINKSNIYQIPFPPQKIYNHTARFQVVVILKKGLNCIRLFNPIYNRADSAMLQYKKMGQCLKNATLKQSLETGKPEKPIVFSLCEWGKNSPWDWGASAGNLWRTTPDIRPIWPWMMLIYNRNVKLYKHASIGAYNDPDMLEVGNGKLTHNENVSHFSLWCMMASPLILGNDIRSMPQNVYDIVTNKNLISINQDPLCKPCKRVKKSKLDVLAKPLSDGTCAVCLFNKSKANKKAKYDIKKLVDDKYVNLLSSSKYSVTDLWKDTTIETNSIISATIPPHGVVVFKIKALK